MQQDHGDPLCAISAIVWPFFQEHLRRYLTKCWLPGESLATAQVSEQSKKQGEIHGAEIQRQGEQPCWLSVPFQPISQAGHQVKNALRCEQHSTLCEKKQKVTKPFIGLRHPMLPIKVW